MSVPIIRPDDDDDDDDDDGAIAYINALSKAGGKASLISTARPQKITNTENENR